MPRDVYLELFDRSEIWQASRAADVPVKFQSDATS